MPLSDIHFQHSLGKVGDVIIGLLAGNWEGRFLGQAVLLTNLFLVWNSFGCNISAATLRRMISCTMVHHDALCHGAFCRDSLLRNAVRSILEHLVLLTRDFLLQCSCCFLSQCVLSDNIDRDGVCWGRSYLNALCTMFPSAKLYCESSSQ